MTAGAEPGAVDSIRGSDEFPPFLSTVLRDGMDTTVSPCHDFDRFVNGAWYARTVVPDSLRHLNAFTATYHATQKYLGRILDSARRVTSTTSDPNLRVLGAYYGSCMATDSIPRQLRRISMLMALPTDTSRAARCQRLAMHHLSDALGYVFVRSVLTPEVEAQMQALIKGIHTEIMARVSALPFVPADAKTRTLDALRYMAFKVAKPTDTVDYSQLHISATDFDAALKSIQEYTFRYKLTRHDGQAKQKWFSSQYNPNAHFNPGNNSIEIPTFIFQWPFFDSRDTDPVISYGAAGVILGHEIIHGVVHKLGSEGEASVHRHAQRLVEHFNALPPIDSVMFNGHASLNENLADLGGVLVAYDAWNKARGTVPDKTIEGFTPEQRFFLHYARMWRSKSTPVALKAMAGAVHSPGRNRINGTLMNVPAFAKAFGCKEGDPMAKPPNERVVIW